MLLIITAIFASTRGADSGKNGSPGVLMTTNRLRRSAVENAMTEPYMAHKQNQLQDTPQGISAFWRHRRRYTHLAVAIALTVWFGLMLTGCQDFWDTVADLIRIDDDAEAQTSRDTDRIETFIIDTSSFMIQVNNDTDSTPQHFVRDGGSIEFLMESNGDVVFNESGSGGRTEEVIAGDTIIFTPNGNTATVIIIFALQN